MDLDHGLDVSVPIPKLDAVRKAAVERHDNVARSLIDAFIAELGVDPDTVAALWIDRYLVTVIRKGRRALHQNIDPGS